MLRTVAATVGRGGSATLADIFTLKSFSLTPYTTPAWLFAILGYFTALWILSCWNS